MSLDRSALPLILVTNDDGVMAPGLLALCQALRSVGQVTVVAPDHNWSASGHSKTMHEPLRVSPTTLADGSRAMACTGSPSDCVALPMLGLLERRPDLVVSGINLGANVAQDMTYSGTVSAAMEAVISGVPGIAVSLDSYVCQKYREAAAFAARLACQALAHPTAKPLLLNVNVPAVAKGEIKGVQVTRLGQRVYRDALVERQDPRGQPYYWIGGEAPGGIEEEGTDIGALAQGRISVTPIMLDMTDHAGVDCLAAWDLE